MKVMGPNAAGAAAAPRAAGRPASGFSIDTSGEAAEATGASSLSQTTGVGSIDALLAMQEVGGPLERRRKAIRRAGAILDVLDDIKIALLEGGASPRALERLMGAVRQERDGTEDPRLESLLDEVETRAAVEMAKLEVSRSLV